MRVDPIPEPTAIRVERVCFHASSVNVSGKAILFLGHSTSGKSTISQLLSERYPVIADDKVWVSGSSSSGWLVGDASDDQFTNADKRIRDEANELIPLLGVIRIFKSDHNEITSLTEIESCRYMMDAVFEIDFQRRCEDCELIKGWFSFVAEIARKKESWGLTFKRDNNIIKTIWNVFEV